MRQSMITILLTVLMSVVGAKAFANDNTVETKRTINVEKAGTLPDLISADEKYEIEELTLTGELNGTDFFLIRDMAGVIVNHNYGDAEFRVKKTDGKLRVLDLSGVKIVEGGRSYYKMSTSSAMETLDSRFTEKDALTPYMFAGCDKLEELILPNNITSISENVFKDESWTRESVNLTSITIPDGVTYIGSNAFATCSALASITIPNSVKYIDQDAFSGTAWYDNQPDGLIYAGKVAYKYKGTMPENMELTIAEGTTGISGSAFSGCNGLTSITIPASVNEIGANAFDGTSWYDNQSDGLVYVGKVAYKYKGMMPENTVVTIEDGTKSISSSAFSGCTTLTSVNIPGSVISIGNSAFYNCGGLTSVEIPNSVTSIGNSAFARCSGLTAVTLSSNMTTIKEKTFSRCSQLASVSIPEGVTSFGESAFESCSSLTSWTIPSSLTTIGSYAFCSCKGSSSLSIPDGVISIGDLAFRSIADLTTLTIAKSVEFIGEKAFFSCSNLSRVDITDISTWCGILFLTRDSNPLYYAHHLYLNGEEVTEVAFPDGMTSISSSVFSGCTALVSVTLPSSVTSIGSYAFYGCSGLSSIAFPNRLSSIGNSAFYNCSEITSVTLPSSVSSIGIYAFGGCKNLSSVYISDLEAWLTCKIENSAFNSSYHILLNGKEITELTVPNSVTSIGNYALPYCSYLTSVTIPNSVTSIGVSAFYQCSGLISINIPNGVTSIDNGAFYGCSSLTSISIPNGVISFGLNAFRGCSSLTAVNIPNSLTTISGSAFYGCTALASVTIPNSVTSIGNYAFNGCSSLTSVTVDQEEPLVVTNSRTFDNCANATLYVPKGSAEAYANANVWKDFLEIKEFVKEESATYVIEEDNIVTVKDAIEPTVKEVEIPATITVDGKELEVKAIADNAFVGNTVIKKISIPESVEEIGEGAFAECTSLRAIYSKSSEPIDLGSGKAAVRTRAEGEEVPASNVFTNVDKRKCILFVPLASIAKYKAAKGWGEFLHIVGIGDLLLGDANGKNGVEPTDIDAVKDFILTDEEPEGFKYQNADADGDGEINAADIVKIVNILR